MSTATTAVNHWPQNKCAKAFWSQRELPAYQRLLKDTAAWMEPRPGQRWVDLGCGCGELTRALWEKSGGTLRQILSLDVAAVNESKIAQLRGQLRPPASEEQVRFLCADLSAGLGQFGEGAFDGAVSGLAIQYAECWNEAKQCWTDERFDALLADIRRVLRPGGSFVFSVNVPEPAWWKVGLSGAKGLFSAPRPLVYLKNFWRMTRYGGWLKKEARRGRFHYLPWSELQTKLQAAGFVGIEHKVTYSGQAYLVRCQKPA